MEGLSAHRSLAVNPVQGAEFTEQTSFPKGAKYCLTLLPNPTFPQENQAHGLLLIFSDTSDLSFQSCLLLCNFSAKFTKGRSCRAWEDGGWAQPSPQTSQNIGDVKARCHTPQPEAGLGALCAR